MAAFGLCFGPFISPAVVGTGANVNTVAVTVFIFIGMCLMGLSFGSMSAYLPELYPTNVRYTASGIAYNVASILGAAPDPVRGGLVELLLRCGCRGWLPGLRFDSERHLHPAHSRNP